MPWFAESWAHRASAIVFLMAAATRQPHGACEYRQCGAEAFYVHGKISIGMLHPMVAHGQQGARELAKKQIRPTVMGGPIPYGLLIS